MKPFFPKRFLSPLILLASLGSLGSANFRNGARLSVRPKLPPEKAI
jgi:hypothetical protein